MNSVTSSPLASRESSPSRVVPKTNPPTRPPGRSRKNSKNSSHDTSPSRSSSSANPPPPPPPPSAAAVARGLSATTTPSLHPADAETTLRSPTPQKPTVTTEIKDAPRWPVSPRLRSPPPINKTSHVALRKADQDVPTINVQRSAVSSEQQEGRLAAPSDGEIDEPLTMAGTRTTARGPGGTSSTLETVQEISQPSTPALGIDGALEKAEHDSRSEQENPIDAAFSKTLKSKDVGGLNDSGSDSGGKGDVKARSNSVAHVVVTRPAGPAAKAYSASAAVGRGKPSGEGSTRNMTVETETVSSIPQVAVGVGPAAGSNGSIRAKPSSETIRPKKEKKKTTRKTTSVTSGTASSKADIFEAKVASAVDEVDSSDSEETFVYESNPPDTSDRPRRFHSRTPSATSMASQIDQRNGSRAAVEGGHSVAMKKSMKFANSFTSNGTEATTGEDDGKGTIRSTVGTGRGTTHHHHIGRWSRNGGNGHPSLFDNESPFPNAAKSKIAGYAARHSPRPTSPRVANSRTAGSTKKSSPISSGYDLDDGADDERTPLMQTVRSTRSSRIRRPGASSLRQLEHQASRQGRSFMARFAGCCVLTFMIILVVSGAIGFMFATTQPLTELKVLALKNVLVSEQDVILDMKVTARNRNLVMVSIDAADIVVFAKSKYAGTNSEWWKRPQRRDMRRRGIVRTRDDDPLDPPEDGDPGTNPNLEIGHVYELDSPLIFEGSPFRHLHTTSLGQIRINHPGNKTIPAGSERWGRVLQHEFDLIVRGTLKYTLPLSQKVRSVGVEGRVTVKPNAADQDPDAVHISV